MKFSLSKFHKLTLSVRTKTTERNYKLNGKNVLSNVRNEKDLGVIIDSSLLFQEHIAKETKLANNVIAISEKGFLNLTEETMVTFYKTKPISINPGTLS